MKPNWTNTFTAKVRAPAPPSNPNNHLEFADLDSGKKAVAEINTSGLDAEEINEGGEDEQDEEEEDDYEIILDSTKLPAGLQTTNDINK